ncbi:MAG: carboxypeptidase-like regulatory domain-containing protein [Ignavibacteriota bacterium]
MKRALFTILFAISIFTFSELSAQSVKGKIIDANNSEPLVGATVKVVGTNHGAIADLDGTYQIDGLTPGNYDIKVSYIGYDDKTIKNVQVKSNEFVKLDIVLQIDGLTTDVIVVESNTSLANEQALLVEQKNSDKVQDGISEQQIKRAPDAAASDVLKRVTGISIVSDKYVFVRGTSERYNNTTLNGVLIPSTDPDKKAFSFDLFPSNLLENIIISKTFTPDLTANFSGGLVQITTKDFPDAFTYNVGVSSAFTTGTSTETFMDYNASEKKFLIFNTGIDNSRSLPGNFPTMQLKNSNFSREEVRDYGRSFSNNWNQISDRAPLNSGFQLSIGNSFNLGKMPFGFMAAYSYKSSFSNKDISRNDYNSDYSKLISLNGRNSESSYLSGGLLNLNLKINDRNKISSKTTFTTNSEDNTEYYSGFTNLNDAFDKQLYVTSFVQRLLLSTQFFGEHNISALNNANIDWKLSYSETHRDEPDRKTMTYQRELQTENPYYAAINPNFGNTYAGGRFFSNLQDINRSAALNFEIPFKFNVPLLNNEFSQTRMKLGVFANGINRNFSARNFGVGYYIGMPFDVLYQPISTIFNQENFDVNKLFYDELTNETDKYTASDNNYASFLMFDIPVNKFRMIIGARYEINEQKVSTTGIIGNPISNSLFTRDLLPSVNIQYKLTESSNLRAAYTQTIAKPELREIAPYSYVDFVSYTSVVGNAIDLRRTLVRNFDLRYEIFPKAGDIISVSAFYKYIDAPIEEVFIATSSNRIKTFQNAKNGAVNYGLEIETRKNLGFLSRHLTDLSLNANVTLVNSKINLENVSTIATTKERRMQGQSPYMINIGLYYDNYNLGTSVNLTYNRFGDRIAEVGLNGFNDISEKGRDLLDFSISKKLLSRIELKFAIKDILDQDQLLIQNVMGTEEIVRGIKSGRSYLFTVSYKY